MSQQPRSLAIQTLNTLGKLLSVINLPDLTLTPERLREKVMKQTGLSDFGDPAFEEGYHRLIQSANTDAQLNFLGRFTAHTLLLDSLKNRLLLMEDRKRRPAVYAHPLPAPLIVTGLPRSGTTFLHRLLDADATSRAIPFWELTRPIPYGEPDRRYAEVKKVMSLRFRLMGPSVDRKHFTRAETPEECVFLLAPTFVTKLCWIVLPVTSYAKWYATAPRAQSYREYSWLLHTLQAVDPARRLLLKAPVHLGALDALTDAVPNAMIIQLLRDPIGAATSLFSLYTSTHAPLTDHQDVPSMARTTLEILEEDVRQNLAFRAKNPGRVYDVYYSDLVADPMGTVQQIYKHFDLPWTEAFARELQTYITENPQGKHGEHRYRPEDFGLTTAELTRRFQDYIDHFGLAKAKADA